MPAPPPVTPPRGPPPPYSPRTPATPQPPIVPLLAGSGPKPYPAGDYLIVRGIYTGDLNDNPVTTLTKKMDEIAASRPDLRDVKVVVSHFGRDDVPSTSCYIRLDPDTYPRSPDSEPRVDLLEWWLTAL
ncbi:hypothetical protein DFH08DRAFT_646467, partial [Mycena albidolilacea]